MSPEDREVITRSIANLWTFNALFIAHFLDLAKKEGWSAEGIERMLQGMDARVDVLEGDDDQAYATGLLATVRNMLSQL